MPLAEWVIYTTNFLFAQFSWVSKRYLRENKVQSAFHSYCSSVFRENFVLFVKGECSYIKTKKKKDLIPL